MLQDEPLSEKEIIKKTNLRTSQVRVIKADLIEQGIIKEVLYGKSKKFEYQYDAPELNTTLFKELRDAKLKDFHAMEQYIYTDMPRMKYLCSFLDSNEQNYYTNCDNTNLDKIHIKTTPEDTAKLKEFRETYFPKLDLASWTTRKGGFRLCIPFPQNILLEKVEKHGTTIIEYPKGIKYSDYTTEENEIIKYHLNKISHLVNGYAASYYGVSNVGSALHRCKYENGGDFPDFLLKITLSVFSKKFRGVHFDLVLYLPPLNQVI